MRMLLQTNEDRWDGLWNECSLYCLDLWIGLIFGKKKPFLEVKYAFLVIFEKISHSEPPLRCSCKHVPPANWKYLQLSKNAAAKPYYKLSLDAQDLTPPDHKIFYHDMIHIYFQFTTPCNFIHYIQGKNDIQ